MNYLQKSKRPNASKKINRIIFAVLLLAVLFFFGPQIKSFVQILNAPIAATKNFVIAPFSGTFNYFKSKSNLADDNNRLDQENRRLKIELLTLDLIRKENAVLKSFLDYNKTPAERFLSKVINKPPLSPYDTLVIDAGTDDDARTGDDFATIGAEIFYTDIPIGKIEEVYKNSSVARLYSSAGQKIQIDISGNLIEAAGTGSGGFRVSIPKDISISAGDAVISSSRVIGVVQSIEIGESNTFQTIYFNYPFRLQEINWVEVARAER